MFLSRIKLNFRHFNEHNFWHNFNNMVDRLCTYGLEPETILFKEKLLNILLYGSEDFICNMKKEIVKAKIKFLKLSERFNVPIFWEFLKNICPNGTYFSHIFSFFQFRYMYRTYFKLDVTFSKFCVLFSLVLLF